jgi:hypothetical protein
MTNMTPSSPIKEPVTKPQSAEAPEKVADKAPDTSTDKSPDKSAKQGPAFSIARPAGRCSVTGRQFAVNEKFMAALRETPAGLERLDVALEAWEAFDKSPMLAFWVARMPAAEEKRPLFVDDNVLLDLFERLGDATEPGKVNFRFLLGLILMRKRLLVYERSRQESAERQFWVVRLKGSENTLDMLDPKLDEQQMRDVSGQLGQILSEES